MDTIKEYITLFFHWLCVNHEYGSTEPSCYVHCTFYSFAFEY